MKKRVTRLFAALLAAVMLTACLVSCTGNGTHDYADVLSDYREMLNNVRNGVVMKAPKADAVALEVLLYDISQICTPEKMGYALKDLNGDGIDELVLMSENYEPYALFTAKRGKAVLLWSWIADGKLQRGVIDHYGYIYGHENWDIETEGWCYKVMCIGKDGTLSSLDYGRRILNADADPVEDTFFVAVGGQEYEIGKMSAVDYIAKDKFGEFTWRSDSTTYEAGFYYINALNGAPAANPGAYAVDFSTYDAVLGTYRQMIPYMEKGLDQVKMEKFSFSDHVEYETFFSVASSASEAIKEKRRYHDATGEYFYPENASLSYGYARKDINGDGVEELMLMLDDHTIFALFTLKQGKPVLLLDTEMTIDADGVIRTGRGIYDRYQSDYYVFEIDETGSLQTKLHFGYLFAEELYGYRIEDGTFLPVKTQDAVDELYLEHFVRVYPNAKPGVRPMTTTEQGKEFVKSVSELTFVPLDAGTILPENGTTYFNFTLNPNDDKALYAHNELTVEMVTADGIEIVWNVDTSGSTNDDFAATVLRGMARADGDTYLLEADGWRIRLEFYVSGAWVTVEQGNVDGMKPWSFQFKMSRNGTGED